MFALLWLIFIFSNVISSSCPNESISSFSDPTKCYYFENQKLNWIVAEQTCNGLEGHLVSIHDVFENVYLQGEANNLFTESISGDFWIGANRLITPGTWTWSDGSPFNFNDFGNEKQSDSNCASMQLQSGNWKPTDCMDIKSFVCLILNALTTSTTTTTKIPPTTTKPKTCPLSWTAHGDFCYKVYDNANWLDAENRCKVDGAHLASIHSFDQNLFLAAFYPGANGCNWRTGAWIGLFTEDYQAHWNWTDNTPFDYQKGHPNPPSAHHFYGFVDLFACSECGYGTGKFDNAPGETVLPKFICKKLPS